LASAAFLTTISTSLKVEHSDIMVTKLE